MAWDGYTVRLSRGRIGLGGWLAGGWTSGACAVLAVLLLGGEPIRGADSHDWDVSSGQWGTWGNWSPWGVPESDETAYVRNGGRAYISSYAVCERLTIGTGAGSGGVTLDANTDSLTVGDDVRVGYSGTGDLLQTGGSDVTIGANLVVGYNSGGTGTYTLRGTGSVLSAVGEYVGRAGSGVFTQEGGTNTITSPTGLVLARDAGSSGVYNLKNGTLQVSALTAGEGTYQFNFGSGMLRTTPGFSSSIDMTLKGAAGVDTLGSATLSGVLSGSGSLTKTGNGSLSLTNANTYTGSTVVESGSLAISSSLASQSIQVYSSMSQGGTGCSIAPNQLTVHSEGTYQLNSGAVNAGVELIYGAFVQGGGTNTTNSLYLGGTYHLNAGILAATSISGSGMLSMGAGTLVANGDIATSVAMALNSSGAVHTNGHNVQLAGPISGTGGFQKLGAGTLTLAGANSFSGTISQTSGTIKAGSSSAFGTGSLSMTGGTLDLNSYTVTLANLYGSSNSVVTDDSAGAGTTTLIVGSPQNTATSQFFGTIKDGATKSVALVKTNASALYLTGDNTYTGDTNVAGGSLVVSGTLAHTNAISVGGYAAGVYQNGSSSHVGTHSLYVGTGDAGSYTLQAGSLYADTQYVGYSANGVFNQLGGTNATGALVGLVLGRVAGATGNYSLVGGSLSSYAQQVGLAGSGELNQSGGVNTVSELYLGCNATGNGVYRLSNAGVLNAGSETIGMHGAGVMTQTGGTNHVSALWMATQSGSAGTYDFGDGTLNCSDAEYIGVSGTAGFHQTGGTNGVAGMLMLGWRAGGDGTYKLSAGNVSAGVEYLGYDGGKGTFTQTGGVNTITSATGLVLGRTAGSSGVYNLNGGTLALQSLNAGEGNAVFNFGGGTLQADASFTSSVAMNLTHDGGDAVVNTAGHHVGLAGDLSGQGGLVKNGNGMLTLSGANDYSGATTVNAGVLLVTGSIESTTTVNRGAVLGGTGSVGSVIVAEGGMLSPGASIGTLTIEGDLSLASDVTLLYELESPTNSDQLHVTGMLAIGEGVIDLGDFSFDFTDLLAGIYTLIDAAGIAGSLGSSVTTTLDGMLATLSISGNDLILSVGVSGGAVPEPGSMLIWGAGLLGLAAWRRKKAVG